MPHSAFGALLRESESACNHKTIVFDILNPVVGCYPTELHQIVARFEHFWRYPESYTPRALAPRLAFDTFFPPNPRALGGFDGCLIRRIIVMRNQQLQSNHKSCRRQYEFFRLAGASSHSWGQNQGDDIRLREVVGSWDSGFAVLSIKIGDLPAQRLLLLPGFSLLCL